MMSKYNDILPKFPQLTKSEIELLHAIREYVALAKEENFYPDGWTPISNEFLAAQLNYHVRTIVRGVRKLEKLNYITLKFGPDLSQRFIKLGEDKNGQ